MTASSAYMLLIGTDPRGRGGIASVIACYLRHAPAPGLRLLVSHVQGSAMAKLATLLGALPRAVAHACDRRCVGFHIHLSSRSSFYRKSLFWLLGRLAGKPVVVHIHSGRFADFMQRSSAPGRVFVRWVLERSARVIVLTPQWEQTLRALAPAARFEVLYNPVELPDDQPVSRRPHQLLFLGKADRNKGLWDLLAAVARLRQRYPDMCLICGGDGDLRRVASLAAELGITDHVRHQGWITGADKERLLRESTTLVLPSYSEGLPVVIIEALAHRLPVIATPVGGVPDVIRADDTGLLVPAGDVDRLVAAIESCFDDPETARRHAERGRELIRTRMAAEAIMAQVSELYRDIQQPRAPGATIR